MELDTLQIPIKLVTSLIELGLTKPAIVHGELLYLVKSLKMWVFLEDDSIQSTENNFPAT